MTASIEPVSNDHSDAALSSAPVFKAGSVPDVVEQRDLYAESELEMRHERTERMIKKALEQA